MNDSFKYKVVNVIAGIALTAFSVLQSFKPFPLNKTDEITALQLIYRLPVSMKQVNGVFETVYLIDSIGIFYCKDFILYRLPTTNDWETNLTVKESEPYFIRRKGDDKGYFLKNVEAEAVTYPADSFLSKNAMSNLGFNAPDDKTWLLAKSVKDHRKQEYVEVYAARQQNQGMKPDSLYLYYSDWPKRYSYSLSPDLDSSKGIKLYKTRMVFNKRPEGPPREFSWELKEVSTEEMQAIQNKIEHFIKELY